MSVRSTAWVLPILLLGGCELIARYAPTRVAVDAGADHDVAPDGATSDGATSDGATPDGAKPDGAKPDGAKPDGAKPDGAKPDASVDGGAITPGWIKVPSGTFLMGSPADEPCRNTAINQPMEILHQVTLTREIEVAPTEVTQAAFEAAMGYNPSTFAGCADCPVETISWPEAAAYCNALSKQASLAPCYVEQGSGAGCASDGTCASGEVCVEGTCRRLATDPKLATIYDCPGYRLPTEAEWERAYRANTQTAYYSGVNDPAACTGCVADAKLLSIGWYCSNSGAKTHPHSQLAPNAWGLYDMAGNVEEWCHDSFVQKLEGDVVDPVADVDDVRMYRGGSHSSISRNLRAAHRGGNIAGYRDDQVGLRCVRSL